MIVIGTRGSKLAMVQAHWVSSELEKRGLENRLEVITTKGDVVQDRFDKMEGKGFFTREIEEALHAKKIDVAVHCLKDLPTTSPNGLSIAAITERADPNDVIISRKPFTFLENGYPDLAGKTIGTSSNRRVYGLGHHFPDARFVPLRGNVPTRIARLEAGIADCIVLAAAGLKRLAMDLDDLYVYRTSPPLLVPAPGQGALALQVRSDYETKLTFFHHQQTSRCVRAERRILAGLEGGCQLPLGVLIQSGTVDRTHLELFLGVEGAALHLSLKGGSPETLAEEALAKLAEAGHLPAPD